MTENVPKCSSFGKEQLEKLRELNVPAVRYRTWYGPDEMMARLLILPTFEGSMDS